MNAKDRNRIKQGLTAIAIGVRQRMPLWTVVDNYTCDLLLDAVKAIEQLEKRKKRQK